MFINLTKIDFCPCNSDSISGGEGDITLQRGKSVTYSKNGNYNIIPNTGYDGFTSVGVTVDVPEPAPNLQSKNSSITKNGNYTISPDEGYDGLSTVDVVVNVPESVPNLQIKSNTYTIFIRCYNRFNIIIWSLAWI